MKSMPRIKSYKQKIKDAIKILNLDSDVSFDMQYWKDADGQIIYVSAACEKITGYTANEFTKDPKLLESIIFPEDLPGWNKHNNLKNNEKLHEAQFRIKHKNGNTIWIEHICKKIYDDNGIVQGFRGINRDITDRKQTDDIYKTSPTVLFLWENKKGWPISFVSENIITLSGYSSEEFLNSGLSYLDIIYEGDIKRVSEEVKYYSENGFNIFEHKPYRIITKDGNIKWVNDKTITKRDINGNITHYHGSVSDITNFKNAEIALAKSKEWFSSIIEQTTEAISVSTKDGYYVFVNPAFCRMMGYSKEELLQMRVFEMQKDGIPKGKANFQNSKFSMEGLTVEVELKRKDKSIFSSEVIVKPIKIDNQNLMLGLVKDITERKKIEHALQESEKKYKNLSDNSIVPIIIHDTEGNIKYTNKSACQILNGSPDEIKSKLITEYIYHDSREKTLIMMQKVLDGTEVVKSEQKLIDFTGKIIDAEVYGSKIIFNNEEVLQVSAIDITKRKQTEVALKEAKDKLEKVIAEQKLILENMSGFVYKQNVDGVFEYISKGVKKITGYSSKEWETHFEKYLTNNSINKTVIENRKNTLSKGIVHSTYEVEVYHKNGNRVILEVSETPIIEFNKVVGIIGVGRDITKRRKNEILNKVLYSISEEAHKSETIEVFYSSLHKIIETLMPAKNFYIAIHNSETNIISFPYFADEFDSAPPSHPLGKGLSAYVLRKKESQIITEAMDRELQKNGEVEERGKLSKIWVGIYLEFEGKYKGVLVVQDYHNEKAYDSEDLKVLQFVSEQIEKVIDKEYTEIELRNSVKELLKTKKELEIINANKDKFFSIIAHDLRSPFMALMGISQMISEDMDSMSVKELKEMTDVVYNSTHNLFKLLENLLNWSRLQMGSYKIHYSNINLKKVSNTVVTLLELAARKKGIILRNNVFDTIAYADDDCVKTILRNLVNNAIKFTNRGGVINLSSKIIDDFIEISVEDNGVGMREKMLENLFSITEKISEVGTEEETGTGLGLILCKELVEKNNGKLNVKSEFGKGSIFSFTLPLSDKDVKK